MMRHADQADHPHSRLLLLLLLLGFPLTLLLMCPGHQPCLLPCLLCHDPSINKQERQHCQHLSSKTHAHKHTHLSAALSPHPATRALCAAASPARCWRLQGPAANLVRSEQTI